MTPNEFFAQIAQYTSAGIITLSPGPFEIRIGKVDIQAAQLLETLYDDFADKTVGELEDALLTDVLRRMHDLSDDGTIQINDNFNLWEDEHVQALLAAWWWAIFFAAQQPK